MAKVAVVTGSSSGIGYETSLLLARNEFETYATMRNLKKSTDLQKIAAEERIPLKVLPLDVNDDTSVSNAIDTIVKENGRIDVLVNNAGYDVFGSLEELTIDEIKGQFETNLFGVIRATKVCNSYNEETGKWYNSKHKFSWWKNRINAISHCLSFKQVCCGRIYRIIKTRTCSI